ncbi:hypothetical protein AB1Y20_009688 [Prymnesium parvum]|uniref:Phosphatidylinositol N-acetylglucosaminyltransferase n=1 Tax=Prymnesium parvum TaxID=97485 RepID=A0AB34K2U4_PRYPA
MEAEEPSPAPGGTEASSSPVATEATPTPHRVCMVCDFFYPSMGGVENHVHQLAQCLLRLGHKVIVLTHQYGARTGVRWLATGLKVYHVPFAAVYDRVLPPTGLLLLPLFRDILIRERITLVHSHAVCTMALECVTLAATMGYRVVYTEHSNFGFSDSADIHINKLCRFVLSQADTVVTVSHTSKENVSLRCHLDPTNVFVIPNALDATQFRPDPDNISPKGCINVVVLTRLVWRKGTHLLVQLIPEVCRRFPYAHFIIGGDGPNRTEIEEMVERHQLQERVELLGAVQHCDVPSVLTRGHIFLNTSLTEAFCIALLEAVSCGLQVVSTRVGGVPEILPPHMLLLTEPEPTALLAALSEVITFARKRPLPNYHREVSQMYSWMQVARRTVKVYDQVALRVRPTLSDRFHGLSELGSLSGMLAILIVALQHLFFNLLCFLRPESNIDLCPDFLFEEWASRRIKVEPLPISERYMSSLSQRRHFVMNGS